MGGRLSTHIIARNKKKITTTIRNQSQCNFGQFDVCSRPTRLKHHSAPRIRTQRDPRSGGDITRASTGASWKRRPPPLSRENTYDSRGVCSREEKGEKRGRVHRSDITERSVRRRESVADGSAVTAGRFPLGESRGATLRRSRGHDVWGARSALTPRRRGPLARPRSPVRCCLLRPTSV